MSENIIETLAALSRLIRKRHAETVQLSETLQDQLRLIEAEIKELVEVVNELRASPEMKPRFDAGKHSQS
ncbi:MAG: hypothetical protein KKA07_00055 [Bacteroidetes bacterium]|nr:hypothetical protein [Bacteroidota bacterium]MBU1717442.1 hypothetical protein [Bacteroidota bacterium]